MAVIDVYTRELLVLCAYDGWDVDSVWTMRTLAAAMSQSMRRPTAVMHDRGPQFAGQVARQLRVLEVDQCRLPPRLPALNGTSERTVKALRWKLLDHIRVTTEAAQLSAFRAMSQGPGGPLGVVGGEPAPGN